VAQAAGHAVAEVGEPDGSEDFLDTGAVLSGQHMEEGDENTPLAL
jgi:hypothetical protein